MQRAYLELLAMRTSAWPIRLQRKTFMWRRVSCAQQEQPATISDSMVEMNAATETGKRFEEEKPSRTGERTFSGQQAGGQRGNGDVIVRPDRFR